MFHVNFRITTMKGAVSHFRVTGDEGGRRSPLELGEVSLFQGPVGSRHQLHVPLGRAAHEQPGLDVVGEEILKKNE